MSDVFPGALPKSLDEIDAAFMTKVLRHNGLISASNEVVAQEEKSVGMTAGYFSAIKKVKCRYKEATDAPTSISISDPTKSTTMTTQTNNPAVTETVEFRFRHADGHWVELESTGQNSLGDPDVQGIMVRSRDASERKRYLNKLRDSESRYRQLFEVNPQPMLTNAVEPGFSRSHCS